MSSASALKWQVSKIVQCPICLEDLQNAKSLPCVHAFCLKCLEGHCANKPTGAEVPCPVCRKEFQIPWLGLQALPNNFFLQNLIDARDAPSKKSDGVLCEVCVLENEEAADIQAALMYCVECDRKMCRRCSRSCRIKTRGRQHEVRALEDEVSAELIKQRVSYCEQHKDERLKLYCHDCEMNLCMMCFAVEHRGHNCGDVGKIADEFAPLFESYVRAVTSRIDDFHAAVDQVGDETAKFQNAVSEHAALVQQRGEAVRQISDHHEAQLLEKLQKDQSDRMEEASTHSTDLTLALTSLESFKAYLEELVAKGSPCDITDAARTMRCQANDLLERCTVPDVYQAPRVSFTPMNLVEFTNEEQNSIGRIDLHISNTEAEAVGELRLHTSRERELEQQLPLLQNESEKVKNDLQTEVQQLKDDLAQSLEKEKRLQEDLDKTSQREKNMCDYVKRVRKRQTKVHSVMEIPNFTISDYRVIETLQGGGISGITTLGDRLYILRKQHNAQPCAPVGMDLNPFGTTAAPCSIRVAQPSSFGTPGTGQKVQIDVYLTADLSPLPGLIIPQLETSKDIASCELNQCFYILDDCSCIYKMVLNGSVTKWFTWVVPDSLVALSVTPLGNVLVCANATRTHTHSLQEISSETGQCIRQIALQETNQCPLYAVLMTTDTFLVCYNYRSNVHLVDENGKITGQYDSKENTRGFRGQMQYRNHFAIDKNSGFVFVADTDDRAVVLTTPALEFIRCVVDSGDLPAMPIKLNFDNATQRLFIGLSNGQVTAMQL